MIISTASKLYPPVIDGKLPAQYGDTLVIPYRLNIVHDFAEINGVVLQLKTVYSNQVIQLNNYVTTDFLTKSTEDPDVYYAIFKNVLQWKDGKELKPLDIGQYYKVQIAFQSMDSEGSDIIGNYSSTGILKYTAYPTIFGVQGLDVDNSNNNIYHYIGEYENTNDMAEKPYSYRFDFYDKNVLIESSGDIFNNDYIFNQDLEDDKLYVLKFTIKTVNNLTIFKSYILQKHPELEINYPFEIRIITVPDEGYNRINLHFTDKQDGYYRLLRTTDLQHWDELITFSLNDKANREDLTIFSDNMIEHEIRYLYAVQQYDDVNNIYAKKLLSDPVANNFEDIFLSDGERQLKIRYNPKVSSYKITTLEQKTDTIGGKYPYFFRNGQLGYREIPISGLLSRLMDDAFLFSDNITNPVLLELLPATLANRPSTSSWELEPYLSDHSIMTTDLTSYNILKERNFKMEVLDWLNNGKAKLFRSPIEGNAIVRLNNVSLTPEEQLGRMLHNFSCTAYEIGDYNFKTLKEMNLVWRFDDSELIKSAKEVLMRTKIKPEDETDFIKRLEFNKEYEIPNGFNAKIFGMPFVTVEITFNDGSQQSFLVGSTGTYNFHLKENQTIIKCKFIKPNSTVPGHEFRGADGYGWGNNSMPYPTFKYSTYIFGSPIYYNGKPVTNYSVYQRPFQIYGSSSIVTKYGGHISKHGKYKNLDKILYLSLEINPLLEEVIPHERNEDSEIVALGQNIKTQEYYNYQFDGMPMANLLEDEGIKKEWSIKDGEIPNLIYIGQGLIADFFAQYKEIETEGKENAK